MEKRKELDMVLVKLDSDFHPWGKRHTEEDYGPDCSCNCKHFLKLEGYLGKDWGVCSNRHSPRKGLLTRYAKKMLRPEYYGKIYLNGLNTL